MAIDFSQVKEVKYNSQDVTKIERSGVTLWQKASGWLDTSTLTLIGNKNNGQGTGVIGVGVGDINKNTVKVRVSYNSDHAMASSWWQWRKTSIYQDPPTNDPDIMLFYCIGNNTNLNMNNSSTALPILTFSQLHQDMEQGMPGWSNQGSIWYKDFTVTRASSSSYPNRYIGIGTLSNVYYHEVGSSNLSTCYATVEKLSDNETLRFNFKGTTLNDYKEDILVEYFDVKIFDE